MVISKVQQVFFMLASKACKPFSRPRAFPLVLVVTCLMSSTGSVVGQTRGVNRQKYRIHINQTDQPIAIDGLLQEEVWSVAEKAENFQLVLPIDEGFARAQTEVMVTYDESNLYIGIICFDPTPGKRVVESLRRDFSFGKNDNFIVFIDTYNDFTNGFAFGISAAGAQWEGSQANGGVCEPELGHQMEICRPELRGSLDRGVRHPLSQHAL